ncbi:Response regulator protein TmoT [compost metagenome]|uniref:Response regulator n=1 Tax=Cupriavidus campinensis TaxID=151783 RepID=A0AAE9HZ74_9BURK|nr:MULTISPECIES: response regulator [Cupriavidus]TSP12291.1 response regulator [Cupriavidus campinensis]URF03526.1 response regulator [Cupriavidus campinensis]CAG2154767.1 Response regulator protein TmoT [Cupriavidus campinensis]
MGPTESFVVIVDDDDAVARAIARLLRAAGVVVDTYASGLTLLERLQADPGYRPDCVILDVCMSDIDGLEVQQRLMPIGLPVLFITAYDVPEARTRALANGALGYLRKPFIASQLLALIPPRRP